MALINCSECNKEVSDKASACPHCGCPIAITPVVKSDKKATGIELTGKNFKGVHIVFIIICFFGLCMMMASNGDKDLRAWHFVKM